MGSRFVAHEEGGIATGTIAPRASAAFLTATARTLPEVLRWTQYPNELALRGAAIQLDGRIKAAVADLVDRGVGEAELPLAEGAPIRPPKQKQIVDRVHKKAVGSLMDALDETGKGQLRSASGTGAAAFLMLPTQQNHHVEDSLLRVAVVRRLGGRVVPKGGPAGPRAPPT